MKKKFLTIGLVLIIMLSLANKSVFAATSTKQITNHTALTHTQEQIRKKYKDAVITYKSSDVYEVKPVTTFPYEAGSLKAQVKTDTLNQINYFRWLAGLNDVNIYEPYMQYAQKGAVVMAANDILSHFPDRPSDMDETFYNEGVKGTSGNLLSSDFNMTSGNISFNSSMASSIKGYVDDTNNVSPNVGHRLSILDPRAKSTVFGYAGVYGVVDMLSASNVKINDAFYAWPSPGNFPVESMEANAKWHVELANSDYFVKDTINIVLKSDGKTYSSQNGDFKVEYEEFYDAYYFDLPTELRNNLTGQSSKFIEGKEVEVQVHNIVDKSGTEYVINYPVKFFSIEDGYKLGDVNEDGQINSKDAVMILKYVVHNIELNEKQLLIADTTKDGRVNSKDAVQILKYVVHNITEF